MKKNRFIVLIISVLIFSLLLYMIFRKFSEPEVRKRTTHAMLGNIERKIVIPGVIIAKKEVQVKSAVSGVLENLYVDVGDHVRKGEIVASVKSIVDPVSYEKIQRNLNVAQLNLETETLNYERNKSLFKSNVISAADFERIEKSYKVVLREYQSAKSELEILDEKSSTAQSVNIIRATSDGTVLELPVKIGGSVMSRSSFHEGTNIVTIADLSSLLFSGRVLENDVSYLNKNDTFNITIGALKDKKIRAKLVFISPKGRFIDGSIKFEIWATIDTPNDQDKIKAGFSANAHIIVEKKANVLYLDEDNIHFEGDSAYVQIMHRNGIVEKKFIGIGISDGIKVEVTRLSKTDQIVIDE